MDVEHVFIDAVKGEMRNFNETRGRRKELVSSIIDGMRPPYRKFGLIVDCGDLPEIIPRMAGATVRTLLQRKPRPRTIDLAVFLNRETSECLFRVKVSRGRCLMEAVRELEL